MEAKPTLRVVKGQPLSGLKRMTEWARARWERITVAAFGKRERRLPLSRTLGACDDGPGNRGHPERVDMLRACIETERYGGVTA